MFVRRDGGGLGELVCFCLRDLMSFLIYLKLGWEIEFCKWENVCNLYN